MSTGGKNMFCTKCGKEFNGEVCPNCGTSTPQPQTVVINTDNAAKNKGVKCPRCRSNNLQVVSDVEGKGAKFWKLCLCGFLGLCGTGKTKTTHYWVCQNCGHKFKV